MKAVGRKIDEIDWQIIAIFQANAREPVVTLARKVGLSRSAVQERLVRLERDKIITGYTVRLGDSVDRAPISAYLFLYLDGRFVSAWRPLSPESPK